MRHALLRVTFNRACMYICKYTGAQRRRGIEGWGCRDTLRAELVEAVSKPRPIRAAGTDVLRSLHRCPLPREESAC